MKIKTKVLVKFEMTEREFSIIVSALTHFADHSGDMEGSDGQVASQMRRDMLNAREDLIR